MCGAPGVALRRARSEPCSSRRSRRLAQAKREASYGALALSRRASWRRSGSGSGSWQPSATSSGPAARVLRSLLAGCATRALAGRDRAAFVRCAPSGRSGAARIGAHRALLLAGRQAAFWWGSPSPRARWPGALRASSCWSDARAQARARPPQPRPAAVPAATSPSPSARRALFAYGCGAAVSPRGGLLGILGLQSARSSICAHRASLALFVSLLARHLIGLRRPVLGPVLASCAGLTVRSARARDAPEVTQGIERGAAWPAACRCLRRLTDATRWLRRLSVRRLRDRNPGSTRSPRRQDCSARAHPTRSRGREAPSHAGPYAVESGARFPRWEPHPITSTPWLRPRTRLQAGSRPRSTPWPAGRGVEPGLRSASYHGQEVAHAIGKYGSEPTHWGHFNTSARRTSCRERLQGRASAP